MIDTTDLVLLWIFFVLAGAWLISGLMKLWRWFFGHTVK